MTTTRWSSDDAPVALTGGPVLPAVVIRWLLEAGDRGIVVDSLPGGRLKLAPASRVTDEDRAFVADHRAELHAAVVYIESVCRARGVQ